MNKWIHFNVNGLIQSPSIILAVAMAMAHRKYKYWILYNWLRFVYIRLANLIACNELPTQNVWWISLFTFHLVRVKIIDEYGNREFVIDENRNFWLKGLFIEFLKNEYDNDCTSVLFLFVYSFLHVFFSSSSFYFRRFFFPSSMSHNVCIWYIFVNFSPFSRIFWFIFAWDLCFLWF